MFQFYRDKRYSEALGVAVEAAEKFPEYRARTSFWVACLRSRTGNPDEALKGLREALQAGVWWAQDSFRDSDLDPVRTRPEFTSILEQNQHLMQSAAKTAEHELLVEKPAATGKSPVLVVLHQRYGERPDVTAFNWMSALSRGIALAVPWSSQVYAPDGRCWDNLEVAEKDAFWVYSKLRNDEEIDLGRVVLAGFSQGAALAIYLTLKRSFPCRGFVAIAPSDWVVPESQRAVERDRPSPAFASFIRSSDPRGFRGRIIIGENDPFLRKAEFLKDEMVRHGLDCNWTVERGMGHEYPKEFESELGKALDFVLGG